jgi:WD40 repeat protein
VKVWDPNTGKELLTLRGHTKPVTSVAWTPDGKTLVTAGGYDRTIRLWDGTTGKELRSWVAHETDVTHVAVSSDGKTLASGSRSLAESSVGLWEGATGKEIRALGGRDVKGVFGLAFAPDGKLLACGGADQKVRIWDVPSGKEVATYSCKAVVGCLAFSPDGKMLAVGTDVVRVLGDLGSGQIQLWDVEKHQLRASVGVYFGAVVAAIAWSPDGRILASVSMRGKAIDLWDGAVRRHGKPLVGPTERVSSLTFAPDGRRLAAGSWDGRVRVWEVPRPAEGKE